MEANKVGVDRNLARIVESTAKHCGLKMPEVYKSDDEDESKL